MLKYGHLECLIHQLLSLNSELKIKSLGSVKLPLTWKLLSISDLKMLFLTIKKRSNYFVTSQGVIVHPLSLIELTRHLYSSSVLSHFRKQVGTSAFSNFFKGNYW